MSDTPFDWGAVRAYYCECRSYKRTAAHFGLTVAAVKKRASRGQWSVNEPKCGENGGTSRGTTSLSVVPCGGTEGTARGTTSIDSVPPGWTSGRDGGTNLDSVVPSTSQEAGDGWTSSSAFVPPEGTGGTDSPEGTSSRSSTPAIPAAINSWTKLEAARFYHARLGWAVHPLLPPDRGDPQERGKKPILKGWPDFRASEVTPDFLTKYFANGSSHNLGCVVRAPWVHVDLDSKPDGGASVRAWLESQPQLAAVPRERTGGGAHLVFLCRDIPEEVLKSKKAPVSRINEAVSAELYVDGLNIVLSPSVHKSGTPYCWEVTGEIPEVAWTDLAQWFGFATPEPKKRGRPAAEKPWWTQWKQDLRTLDLTAAMNELGLLGECLDPDASKWAVRCPWESEHTGNPAGNPNSSTVIFNAPETLPAFHCLHAHCDGRELKDLLEMLEKSFPGIIARHCLRTRQWEPAQKNRDGRTRILLPGIGRPDSAFAREMGACIAPCLEWFRKGTVVCSIGVRQISEKVSSLVFCPVQPVEAITAAELYAEVGLLKKTESGQVEFLPTSMSRECAGMLLAAPQFRERLPEVLRILDVQLPILLDGDVLYPSKGYDARFRSYCPPDAPEPEPMDLAGAKTVLRDLHSEFCWKDEQSVIHAFARLITPYCRGLMGWDARFPLWHYVANRPRAGKDYLAVIPPLVYQGRNCEDAPLDRDTEETRKRITTALMAGRRNMHFANCQGHIQDQHFIGAITSKTFAARNLGSTEAKADLVLPNEVEFSLSANVGLTFREDVEPRTRRIALEFYVENANSRHFARPDLHGWVFANRPKILGAVAALVQHWIAQGCPPGPTPFNSFPEWARVVGGIMMACGLGDPCLSHEQDDLGGDRQDRAMRAVFRIGYANCPDQWIEKSRLFELLEAAQDDEALGFFCTEGDIASRPAKVRIGKALRHFRNRHLDGIQLHMESNAKSQRQRVKFTQPTAPDRLQLDRVLGQVGQVGQVYDVRKLSEENSEEEKREEGIKEREVQTSRTSAQRAQPAQTGRAEVRGVHCVSRADLDRIIDDLIDAPSDRIALDLETYGAGKGDGLDPWRGDIRLLTLRREGGPVWMLDLMATGYDLGSLGEMLREATIVAHNARFDCLWLRVKCGLRLPRVFCTLTAARLLTAGTKPGNNLDQCLERYLGVAKGPDLSRSDWGAMFLTDDQLAYASRDVAHLHDLAGVLEKEIGKAGLERVWSLESSLLTRVVEMEAAGIRVDVEKLKAIASRANAEASKACSDLREALGNPGLNPASPAQLLDALQSAGIELESTAEDALKAADDGRLIPLLLAHREASKRAQQAEALIGHVQRDGRIHARFEPTGTATGRFSSKDPNLQNIGRGELREAFVPEPGHKLIVADYSQVELRAAAAIAGETKMIEAYRAGADLHRLTASIVLGKPESEVTKSDRQTAKSSNFGLIYGQSAPGLVRYAASSYGVHLDPAQAQQIRAAFFRTYGQLRQWHGLSHQQAEKGVTEVRTRLGRRRLIPATAGEWERFTALVNTPVQGGCADGMKQAIVLLAGRLPEGARILSTVHDELIVEAPEAQAEAVCELVAATMREAMEALFPEVPIEVEAGTCNHWGEK